MRMPSFIARLRQPKRQKLVRKPYVIIRRDRDEIWTGAERQWLHEMMSNSIWQKLMRFTDDAICMDILEGARESRDPEWIEAMVTGRLRERDYYAKHARVSVKAEPPDPERLDPGEEGGPPAPDKIVDENDERVTIQMMDEDQEQGDT